MRIYENPLYILPQKIIVIIGRRINQRILLPDTLKKIEIFTEKDMDKLTQIIEKDQLPLKYGGRLNTKSAVRNFLYLQLLF